MWSLIIERAYYFIKEHRGVIREATEIWEGRDERKSWTAHVIREKIDFRVSDPDPGKYAAHSDMYHFMSAVGTTGDRYRNDSGF